MIRIYGASDDLVEIEGDVREELYAIDRARSIAIGDHDGGIDVIVQYEMGVWRIAVEPLGENVPLPWPVRMEMHDCGYSPVLIADCPPGTPVAFDNGSES